MNPMGIAVGLLLGVAMNNIPVGLLLGVVFAMMWD